MKKYLISFLFAISACVTATSVGAQVWTEVNSGNANPCFIDANSGVYACTCPQGYTWGDATGTNCTYGGAIAGCWNPDNGGQGTCQECGYGGTIVLGQYACFGGSGGQQNMGSTIIGTTPSSGSYCTQNSECQSYNAGCTATNSSGVCTNWGGGPSSGGYSSN